MSEEIRCKNCQTVLVEWGQQMQCPNCGVIYFTFDDNIKEDENIDKD